MPRIAITLRERLSSTSDAWRERNAIPPGLYVTLVRKDNGRQVRDDTIIHRKVIPKRSCDDVTLKTALDELQNTFLTEVERRGYVIRLRNKSKKNIDGKTLMSNVRKMKVLSDYEAALNQLPYTEEQIQDVEEVIGGAFGQMEEHDNFSNMTVARGALRVLVEKLGLLLVRRACEAESIL